MGIEVEEALVPIMSGGADAPAHWWELSEPADASVASDTGLAGGANGLREGDTRFLGVSSEVAVPYAGCCGVAFGDGNDANGCLRLPTITRFYSDSDALSITVQVQHLDGPAARGTLLYLASAPTTDATDRIWFGVVKAAKAARLEVRKGGANLAVESDSDFFAADACGPPNWCHLAATVSAEAGRGMRLYRGNADGSHRALPDAFLETWLCFSRVSAHGDPIHLFVFCLSQAQCVHR